MKSYRHLILVFAVAVCMPVTRAQVTLNPAATRALGAARLEQISTLTNLQPNLVEGRELNSPQGVALDLTVNPPHLYVSDTFNNRVLGWKNATTFTTGATADIVIGQSDLFTTLPQGPGRGGSTRPSSGVTAPMGLTVDAAGNLYVIDAGNNRILRYPQPFNPNVTDQFPDLVLGHQNFATNAPNDGGISASTLSFSTAGGVAQAYMKFDLPNGAGNLWVADVGNQRVLRFNSAVLTAGNNGPAADIVLGQPDFATNSLPTKYDPTSLTTLNYPTGIAFDAIGRLFVTESQPTSSTTTTANRSRILVYVPPYSSFQTAQRIIGTVLSTDPVQPPAISAEQIGQGAGDVFNINNNIAVADPINNRILVFPPFEQFTSNIFTQNALFAIGQADVNSGKANRGNADANSNSLQFGLDAAFQPLVAGANPPEPAELYVADTGNNRVLVYPVIPNSSTLGFNAATRLLGQQQFSEQAANYIEGREFQFSNNTGAADAGIAMDLKSNPPHLYIADTYNNRILCFTDLRTVKTGDTATFVIGQPDLFHAIPNYNPNNIEGSSSNIPTQTGLFHPTGVAVDAAGNLYVADSGNSRVLRFPAPFAQPTKVNQAADLVLGQATFTSKITDVSGTRMGEPYGLTFAPAQGSFGGGLLVSDVIDDRVLMFPGTSFVSGQSATVVWGQTSLSTAVTGSQDNRFSGPHGVAIDSSYRLWVADTGNNRVLVFDDIRRVGTDPHSLVSIPGLTTPRGVFIDQYLSPSAPAGTTPTDEVWIGESGAAIRFFGGFNSLFTSGFTPDLAIPEAGGAIALAIDSNNALYVCDIANRVVIHYVGLVVLNAASYNKVRANVSPNEIVSIFSLGSQFGAGQAGATSAPLPTSLVAIQAQLNGNPVPLYYVSPGQINALIPNNAPTSGTADLQILRTDNGQTLGDTTLNMTTVAPAVFTQNGSGQGQAAALNQDGTINSSSNPISRGQVLQVFGTGMGNIPGAPNDGSAVSGATPTPDTPQAFINGIACQVQYSGLAPGQVGVWQINILIDTTVPPTANSPNHVSDLTILMDGVPSDSQVLYGIQTLVWVKQ
jgi:uncharacterized protein (TIGR03437 family)